MENTKWLALQHFADGAGEGAGAETGSNDGNAHHQEAGSTPRSDNREDVIYGVVEGTNESSAAEEQVSVPEESPEEEFERLIAKGGKFRDVYEKRMRGAVMDRVKTTNEELAKRNGEREIYAGVFSELAKKYGVDGNDPAAVAKAFMDDPDRLEEEALERGMPTEELRRIKETERELAAVKSKEAARREAEERAKREAAAKKQYLAWLEEGKQLKAIYPEFDIAKESQNPEFVSAVRSGLSMRRAYEGLHHDELSARRVSAAVQRAEKGMADTIRAGASRPAEGAAMGRASTIHKQNVADLDGHDIREIIKRVERGERVTFS